VDESSALRVEEVEGLLDLLDFVVGDAGTVVVLGAEGGLPHAGVALDDGSGGLLGGHPKISIIYLYSVSWETITACSEDWEPARLEEKAVLAV
jgi:hypothetical protein